MRQARGKSYRDFLREETERDPAFTEAYEETLAEARLADELVRIRDERGMTQQQLARASGVAQPMISKFERAAQVPSFTTLQRLLKALRAVAEIEGDGVHIYTAEQMAERAAPHIGLNHPPTRDPEFGGVFDAWLTNFHEKRGAAVAAQAMASFLRLYDAHVHTTSFDMWTSASAVAGVLPTNTSSVRSTMERAPSQASATTAQPKQRTEQPTGRLALA